MNNSGKTRFDWTRYITLSEDLLNQMKADEEDLARCGISRAYYGAFHLVVVYMKKNDIYRDVVGEGSHQTVIKDCISYGSSSNREAGKLWKTIGEKLKRLYECRKKADYKECYFPAMIPPTACMKDELKKAVCYAKEVQDNVVLLEEAEAS